MFIYLYVYLFILGREGAFFLLIFFKKYYSFHYLCIHLIVYSFTSDFIYALCTECAYVSTHSFTITKDCSVSCDDLMVMCISRSMWSRAEVFRSLLVQAWFLFLRVD